MRAILVWASLSLVFLFPSFTKCLAQEYYILDTEEAFTVGQGNLQAEIEFGITKQPDASELYNLPRLRLTYGLSEWADVEFEYEYLVVRGTDFIEFDGGKTNVDHDDEGTGDLRIRLKVVPYEFGPHRMGFQFVTKLPNADQGKGLGTNETDFTWQVLLSSDLGRLRTHLNAGVAVLGDPSRNRNQNDFFVWGIGGEYALSDSLTLMGEVEGSTAAEHGTAGFTENIAENSEGNARARVRLALTGPIGAWRWGVSGFKGVNSHTEDWGAQFGLSRTWGAGAPTGVATPPRREGSLIESYFNPLKTEEAYSIGERNFRAEVALGYVNQPDGSDLYILPDLTVGWGIGPWADLELEFQYLKVEDTSRFDPEGAVVETDMDKDGRGDVRVKFKASPFECRYGRLGAEFVTKLPSAEDDGALGTDEVDFIAKALFSTDWSRFFGNSPVGRLKTHLNAGMAIQGDTQELSQQEDYFIWGVAAEYEIMRALTMWAEVEGSTNGKTSLNISEGDFGNAYAEARLGLTGPLPDIAFLRGWKWGITASTGLNNHSRDWTASVGFSHTCGL
ncbi:MAG: hypothetical protein JSV16_10340 [Candidatus Hydrogenedentota bacterium]|nr:MAG: hypothetical protein JSV16_10340 [Candidatus Hydrogenedentota bacterium]